MSYNALAPIFECPNQLVAGGWHWLAGPAPAPASLPNGLYTIANRRLHHFNAQETCQAKIIF